MTIRLRAHHLLCMLTYVGRGYTPAFVANYDAVVVRLGAGELIQLIHGPDDICAPLSAEDEPHCHRDSVIERDRLARLAISDLLAQAVDITMPFALDKSVLSAMRVAFSTGEIRLACTGCEWVNLCDGVAQSGYSGAQLVPRTC